MSTISKGGLRRLNLLAAFLHFGQAAVVLLISNNVRLPVTGSYLAYDTTSHSLMPAAKTLFQMPFTWLIASFFIISGVSHLLAATLYHKRYNHNLELGRNPLRWIEYALGAGIMMVAIAMLVGVYNADSLGMIFGLTGVMCLMGWVMEYVNYQRQKVTWMPYIAGVIAGTIPWLVVAHYLRLGAEQGSGAPTFVYFIFISMFITFSSFAFNMILHYRQFGKWRNYLYTEKTYIWLSFIAKAALAWQVFAGILRP